MAIFKKRNFSIPLGPGLGSADMSVVFKINSKGIFACQLPEQIVSFFKVFEKYDDGVWCDKDRSGSLSIYAPTLIALETLLEKALRACNEPAVTEEHVILYNIESHISFATNEQDEIFPNASFEGAAWATDIGDDVYGGHSSSNVSKGGYSLTVGAIAMTKITKSIGNKTTVDYQRYNKGASHLNSRDNPAAMLNSWCSFRLPDRPKEMPYSDEAAMFFYNLMLGMARLSKMIQESTHDQEHLLTLIHSGHGNLLGSPK